MGYEKTILCLANSRKNSGRCIAGKEYSSKGFGAWVRPISARSSQEISEADRRYENGVRASLLDIIEIPMLQHQPKDYQTENHLIDGDQYWIRRSKLTWNDLSGAADRVKGPLWLNTASSYYGINDRIAVADAAKLTTSLLLIEPTDLELRVAREGGMYGPAKRTVRARFRLNGDEYLLVVTDPEVEQRYLQQNDGSYPIEKALLCVSLGEPYQGHAYKLVAAVITPS